MGQPMASCCNPGTHPGSHQIQISPYTRDSLALAAAGNFEPVSHLKQIDKAIEETLQKALKYRNTNPTTSSDLHNDNMWSLEVKDQDNKSQTIYCRGSLQGQELQGEATIYFPRGEVFESKIVNGEPVQGAFVFKKGCFYTGQISNFNAQGHGRYENHDSGYVYEGHWSKSLPHGKGKQTYKNGDRYEGQIMYGEKFGYGVYHFADGRVYEGTFYYNQTDGKGKISYPDSSSYDGEWKLGKFHGKGVFKWANGQTYHGEYLQGLRHGRGKYNFRNGSYYDGGWQNGMQSGRGRFHEGYDDIEGEWNQGQLVGQ